MSYFHQNDNIKIMKDTASFTWIVLSVSPSPDSVSRLYKVELLINSSIQNATIWDFVDVYLKKELKDKQTLSIPLSSFIAFWEWKFWVFTILKDNTVKLVYVTLWRKNSTSVEVAAWLDEWVKYVKEWALNLSDWDNIKEIK
jgi:hypothetical protein